MASRQDLYFPLPDLGMAGNERDVPYIVTQQLALLLLTRIQMIEIRDVELFSKICFGVFFCWVVSPD